MRGSRSATVVCACALVGLVVRGFLVGPTSLPTLPDGTLMLLAQLFSRTITTLTGSGQEGTQLSRQSTSDQLRQPETADAAAEVPYVTDWRHACVRQPLAAC